MRKATPAGEEAASSTEESRTSVVTDTEVIVGHGQTASDGGNVFNSGGISFASPKLLTRPSLYVTNCNVMDRNTWNHLSALEELVMSFVWSSGSVTAEDVRTSLAARHPMKDSTVRTILRRLESKGYLTHTVEGRTYIYRPVDPGESVAAQAVRRIVDRFCNGSLEQLLIGMVDNDIIDGKELERLAKRITASRKTKRRKP